MYYGSLVVFEIHEKDILQTFQHLQAVACQPVMESVVGMASPGPFLLAMIHIPTSLFSTVLGL